MNKNQQYNWLINADLIDYDNKHIWHRDKYSWRKSKIPKFSKFTRHINYKTGRNIKCVKSSIKKIRRVYEFAYLNHKTTELCILFGDVKCGYCDGINNNILNYILDV